MAIELSGRLLVSLFAALALLPIAIVCLSHGLFRRSAIWTVSAGVVAACVALSNAFGIVDLAIGGLCWLVVFPGATWWERPLKTLALGLVTYACISPWLSPTMIRAMRSNSASVGGGSFHKCPLKISPHLRFFILLAYFPTAFVVASYLGNIDLIPQPRRYEM